MFIYPIKTAQITSSSSGYGWEDKAGNDHFVLQSKVKHDGIVRSLFSGLSSWIPGSPSIPIDSSKERSVPGHNRNESKSSDVIKCSESNEIIQPAKIHSIYPNLNEVKISHPNSNEKFTTYAKPPSYSSTIVSPDISVLNGLKDVTNNEKKSIDNYQFRILLKCPTQKSNYIIAVDNIFPNIYTDWNSVQDELRERIITNIILNTKDYVDSITPPNGQSNEVNRNQLDNSFLKYFKEFANGMEDPALISTLVELENIRDKFKSYFQSSLRRDKVIGAYEATVLFYGKKNVTHLEKGIILLTKNSMMYLRDITQSKLGSVDTEHYDGNSQSTYLNETNIDYKGNSTIFKFSIPLSSVISVNILPFGTLLGGEFLHIITKEKRYIFDVASRQKELFTAIKILCDATVQRILECVEQSALQSNNNNGNDKIAGGDLSTITESNKGFNALSMNKSKENANITTSSDDINSDCNVNLNEELSDDEFDEFTPNGDFTSENMGTVNETSSKNINSLSPLKGAMEPEIVDSIESLNIGVYGKISTYGISSINDVFSRNRDKEYRELTLLPYPEKLIIFDSKCKFPIGKENVSGILTLSNNFLAFIGYKNSVTVDSSSFITKNMDPKLIIVVPFTQIIDVKQQINKVKTPIVGGTTSKLSIFSSSALTIFTKSKSNYSVIFSGNLERDRFFEAIMSALKAVDYKNNVDFIIGDRNPSYILALQSFFLDSNKALDTKSSVANVYESSESFSNIQSRKLSISDSKKTEVSISNETFGLQYCLILQRDIFNQPLINKKSRKNIYDVRVRPFFESLENERIWTNYFNIYGKNVCMTKEFDILRLMLVKTLGVPFKYKADFWMIASGTWYSRPSASYYKTLISTISKNASSLSFAEEIEKDVRRSMPGHFAYKTKEGIDSLRRLLTAYSYRNPAVGYAQALNIISAYLLLHLREEDAFWVLCNIVEVLLPDYYSTTLAGGVIDQSVLNILVHKHLPKLHKHFDKIGLELSTISVPWFLCIFLATIEMDVGLTFLDIFFLEGPKAIFWISLGILQICEQQLLNTVDDDQAMRVIKNFFIRLGDINNFAVYTNDMAESDDDILDLNNPHEIKSDEGQEDESKQTNVNIENNFNYNQQEKYDNDEIDINRIGSSYKDLIRFKLLNPLPSYAEVLSSDAGTLTGTELLQHLLKCVYVIFTPAVTNDVVEDLRKKCRYDVSVRLEESNKKNQIRILSEKISLNNHELSIIYDNFQNAIVSHDVGSPDAKELKSAYEKTQEEHCLRFHAIKRGGWGLDEKIRRIPTNISIENFKKTLTIFDFRDIVQRISPWRLKLSSRFKGGNNVESIPQLQRKFSLLSINEPNNEENVDEVEYLSLTDRIYLYCVIRNNHILKDDINPKIDVSNYTINFATVAHVLHTIAKQPANSKLQFFFDIHDVDADGYLNGDEINAMIASLLELESTYIAFFDIEESNSTISKSPIVHQKNESSTLESVINVGTGIISAISKSIVSTPVSSFRPTAALDLDINEDLEDLNRMHNGKKRESLPNSEVNNTNQEYGQVEKDFLKVDTKSVRRNSNAKSIDMIDVSEQINSSKEFMKDISTFSHSVINLSIDKSSRLKALNVAETNKSQRASQRPLNHRASISLGSMSDLQNDQVEKEDKPASRLGTRSPSTDSPRIIAAGKLSFNDFLLTILSLPSIARFFERSSVIREYEIF